MIYFDSAATTPLDPDVSIYLIEILNNVYGNPSSIHKSGQEAKAVIEKSRRQISKSFNCKPNEIIFTAESSFYQFLAKVRKFKRKLFGDSNIF